MTSAIGTTVITRVIAQDFAEPTLISLNASEALGELYSYELIFSAGDDDLDIEAILGHQITVHSYHDGESSERFYHGYIIELSQEGWTDKGRAIFRAVLKPWLWLLTQTNDCRIFQEQSVPDILMEIFKDHGFTEYDMQLYDNHSPRSYCVQYRESDFNFVSRLMQEEGIYYFFEHVEGSHKLVITDSAASHLTLSQAQVPYYPPGSNAVREEMCFNLWSPLHQIRTGGVTLNAYDFNKPKASLLTKHLMQRNHDFSEHEKYDYPGKYFEFADGERYSRLQTEMKYCTTRVFDGQGNTIDTAPGYTFTLSGHPLDKLNLEYLITTAEHILTAENQDAIDTSAANFQVRTQSINNEVVFRTQPSAVKGMVNGPQTALVVGPSADEIHTDEYGRIKVQFFWDRYGKKNENSSCWIRVAQTLAGATWGAQFLPRIGQEVMIEFLEGDPDRPIVTGRFYNADNMPPYTLPANKTQSGIKSRSSPGGSPANFNEIRMEDKKGGEELYIQAEKDENILVKNCKTESVGVDETIDIGNDRTEKVGKNETLTVGVDRTRDVGNNETVNVATNQTLSVGGDREKSVGKNETTQIGINREVNVGKDESITIGASQGVSVEKSAALEVGESQTITVGENRTIEIGKNDRLEVGKKLLIEAGDEITLKTGNASIVMKKDGTITIKGKDLKLDGSGKINIKASKDVIVKGSKVGLN